MSNMSSKKTKELGPTSEKEEHQGTEKRFTKISEKQIAQQIRQKLGVLGTLLINIGTIRKKGLTYFFLSDPDQAINSIKVGANETLYLMKVRQHLTKIGISKEVAHHLDGLINAIHKEMMDILNKIEEN